MALITSANLDYTPFLGQSDGKKNASWLIDFQNTNTFTIKSI